MATITAATASIALTISGLYESPRQLQGFAADDVFDIEAQEPAEVQMGVDGHLSAGFVYTPVKWSITLQADSASNAVFDQWYESQKTIQDVYFANLVVLLKSVGSKWSMNNGVLTSYQAMPSAGKVLKPRKHTITFESISPASA